MLRPGEMADAEIVEWLNLHQEEFERSARVATSWRRSACRERCCALRAAPDGCAAEQGAPSPPAGAHRAGALRRCLLPRQARAPLAEPTGDDTRGDDLSLLNREASRIAGHPAEVICDVSGRHVGYVQDADDSRRSEGSRMWLTPDVCYRLYRSTTRTGRPARPRQGDRCLRSRGVAPMRRLPRSARQLLRVPVRRLCRAVARVDGGYGRGLIDSNSRQSGRLRLYAGVRRPARLSRRR